MAKAIQTVYKGYKFRSRLEARWAVFFDALGITWQYEKEGYELPPRPFVAELADAFEDSDFDEKRERQAWESRQQLIGTLWYLPDFWLLEQECWVEIKGEHSTGNEQEVAMRLARATHRRVYLFDTGLEFEVDGEIVPHAWAFEEGTGALLGAGWGWCECPICHQFAIHNVDPDTGDGSLMHMRCLLSHVYGFPARTIPTNIFEHMDATRRLFGAYTKARQARFEYGEQP